MGLPEIRSILSKSTGFRAVDGRFAKAVPGNVSFIAQCSAIDLEHQQISKEYNGPTLNAALLVFCVPITVHFALNGSRVEPTTAQFVPALN
jgi:hypothetical protein